MTSVSQSYLHTVAVPQTPQSPISGSPPSTIATARSPPNSPPRPVGTAAPVVTEPLLPATVAELNQQELHRSSKPKGRRTSTPSVSVVYTAAAVTQSCGGGNSQTIEGATRARIVYKHIKISLFLLATKSFAHAIIHLQHC